MNLKKKKSLFLIILPLLFGLKEVFAIHHHPRIPINFLEDSNFLGKKRLILLNITQPEALKLKKAVELKNCEIENRKIEFLYIKKKEYFYLKNDEIEESLKYFLPHKISLIGLDGFLKFSNNKIETLETYFSFIDQMPLRKKEKKFDRLCN